MKQTIYLFTIIVILTACKQNTSTEVATEETSQATATSATTDSTVVVANEQTLKEPPKLELTTLGNSGDIDPADGVNYFFSQNDKIIFEFNETIPTDIKDSGKVSGKIIINNKTYKINKSVRIGDSGYTISGEGVLINIPKIIWNGDEDGGDCQEGKAPTIEIRLNNQILDLNNIQVDYCYFSY
jgi:hypothetical protein